MQQGGARPCAVKYISDQGRRQAAQAQFILPLETELRFSGTRGGECHLKRRARISCAASIARRSAFLRALEERVARNGLAVADLVGHETLQIHHR